MRWYKKIPSFFRWLLTYFIACIGSLLGFIAPKERYDIILLFSGHIGDYVVQWDCLKQLSRHWQGKRILLLCSGGSVPIVNAVGPFPDHLTVVTGKKAFRTVIGLRGDAVIYLGFVRYLSYDFLVKMIHAKEKIVYDLRLQSVYPFPNRLRNAIYTRVIPPLEKEENRLLHAAYEASVLMNAEIPPRLPDFRFATPDRIINRPYFLLSPGCASYESKRWPAERFAALAEFAAEQTGCLCVIAGTAEDTDIARSIASQCRCEVMDTCGRTDFRDLLALIGHAAFVIGNDTGTAHLAVAFRVDSFTICSDAWGSVFFPYPKELCEGVAVEAIRTNRPCSGCIFPPAKPTPECQAVQGRTGLYACVLAITADDAISRLKESGLLNKHIRVTCSEI